MKISFQQAKAAYDISKMVYDGVINRQEGIDRLEKEGMNKGSATIYIAIYQYLINGQTFSRTLNAESFDYFLQQILADKGKDQLFVALVALKNHIDYFEAVQNTRMVLVRGIYHKYSSLYSQNKITEILIEDDEEKAFPEGRERYRIHISKERNPELVKLAKEKHFERDALLCCRVCNFSFVSSYGDIGKGFIEAHHTFPISELTQETKTKVEDLALVCSNCHRMLHRKRPWITIENLKEIKRQFT